MCFLARAGGPRPKKIYFLPPRARRARALEGRKGMREGLCPSHSPFQTAS
jgi:hypothetical protein